MIAALLLLAGCAPTTDEQVRLTGIGTGRAAPNPKPVPRFTENSFITADGQILPLRKWLPQAHRNSEVKAVILALHGFNDYDNAFDGPGEIWAKAGIATYAYDQRGFGAAPERGFWPGRAALAADAATATEVLRELYPGVRVYLLGESMGGAVAVIALTGESGTPVPDVDGVILTAPAVWGRSTMDVLPRLALWAGVRLMPRLTLTGRGLKIKPSDNIEMLRALSRDPLVIKGTRVDAIEGLVDLMDAALAAAPAIDLPMLLLYGDRDELVPKEATELWVENLPYRTRLTRKLAWYDHGYHMLLRDLQAPMVWRDIANWIDDHRAPLPSGADRRASDVLFARGAKGPLTLPALRAGSLPLPLAEREN